MRGEHRGYGVANTGTVPAVLPGTKETEGLSPVFAGLVEILWAMMS